MRVCLGGDDITQGLPRVEELFEARTPKGVAPIAEATGRITIEESERQMRLVITPDDGSEEIAYPVLRRSRLLIEDGEHVSVGQKLINGPVDPKQVLRIMGPRAAQKFLVDEVQGVYRRQGIGIHDKHVEVIVRQMLRRVTVIESGGIICCPASRRAQPLRGRQPPRCIRGQDAGLRPSRAHGYHQGIPGDRVLAVRSLPSSRRPAS